MSAPIIERVHLTFCATRISRLAMPQNIARAIRRTLYNPSRHHDCASTLRCALCPAPAALCPILSPGRNRLCAFRRFDETNDEKAPSPNGEAARLSCTPQSEVTRAGAQLPLSAPSDCPAYVHPSDCVGTAETLDRQRVPRWQTRPRRVFQRMGRSRKWGRKEQRQRKDQ